MSPVKPTFFKSQSNFRTWLEKNHDEVTELLVGFYKKDSGKGGITYQEALDEALAFGWIDGVRHSIDDARWSIRFTPRKRTSIWSAINIARVGELIRLGTMHASGLRSARFLRPTPFLTWKSRPTAAICSATLAWPARSPPSRRAKL